MHCPPNLVYDPILQTCTYPKDAVSCLDHNDYVYLPGQSTPVPHVTAPFDVSLVCQTNHWPNGYYPHPTDCSFYLQCVDGFTISIACTAGSVYDPEWKGCVNPSLAKPCNDFRTTQVPYTTQRYVTTTSPRYNLTNICFLYKLPDGIYPDPGSCVHFIECTNQDTKHLICPDGLKFNSKSLYCDDVHLVNCNDNYNFQFEHIVVR
ncbi:unnamed protein product [Lymnaea stagnalis]|uniref:Chitin-binding type-2 domain-containing protein n=1 Tax=Lymnaea stagnalis TaxID=6523 RepID=A0AAV2H4A8_LYMST